MEVSEQELKPFYDENGYLSPLSMNKFLASKKIIRFGRGNEVILLLDKNYGTKYFELMDQIKKIVRRKKFKTSEEVKEITNTQNEDIKAEDIPF